MDDPKWRKRRDREVATEVCDDVLDLRKPESSLLRLKRNPEERGTMRVPRKQKPKARDVESVTDLVAERILEKDAEIRRRKDEWQTTIPQGVDLSEIVAERIVRMQQVERFPYTNSVITKKLEIRTENRTGPLGRTRDRSRRLERNSRTRDDTPIRPCSSKIPQRARDRSASSASPSGSPSRPRFQLNPNPAGRRMLVRNNAVQVDITREGMPSSRTQTDLLDRGRHEHVQIVQRPNTTTKRVQARLYTTSTAETDPVQHEYLYRSKFTNTDSYYQRKDKKVQKRREYITEGDLLCIDWINKYLFSANLQPGRYVVDQKVREISEIGTKSTILSNFESW